MKPLSPTGTVRERFLAAQGVAREGGEAWEGAGNEDDFEASYLGWEIARCATGLRPDDRRALAALAAACLVALRAGSTRVPLDDDALRPVLVRLGAESVEASVRSILIRARAGEAGDPVTAVIGRPGDRKPLIVDGPWLYPERMRRLEERFCARVRERLVGPVSPQEARSIGRALAAVSAGPPTLTEEQKRAVREALGAAMALVTGGPGTGKTTIVVAVLRALAWRGTSTESVAIATPTGKAAQRLRSAIAAGLASSPRDIAEAALRASPPLPQTLHRLLGWSPSSDRFARHENDRLPHRVVIVDEASMVDLAMMDRLVRALAPDARLVLLGDADQLPSVEAGAVFRDLCAGLGAVRLTVNLRVADDPSARRIVAAARAVNRGATDGQFTASVTLRRGVEELRFEGVEHLAVPWADVEGDLLGRWWQERVVGVDGFARRMGRTYRMHGGAFDDEARSEIRALFEHLAGARILCATRSLGIASAASINARLLAKLTGRSLFGRRRSHAELAAGAPVMVERNDYERRLFNGDQGVVLRVDAGSGAELMAVFPSGVDHAAAERSPGWHGPRTCRPGESVAAFPVSSAGPIAPAFAMTVHKAQGSEFEHVVLVLPDVDLPLVTRELIYTAITRARRSVLLVGSRELLVRAVSRSVRRDSGIAEKLLLARH